MTPLLCQFTLCPILIAAELISLITVVSTFMYEQILRGSKYDSRYNWEEKC